MLILHKYKNSRGQYLHKDGQFILTSKNIYDIINLVMTIKFKMDILKGGASE